MADDQIVVYCDLTLYRGADYAADVIIAEDNEVPIDLTGFTAEAQVRQFPESPEAESFICSVDGAGIHLTMPRESVDRLGFTQGKYDLYITDSGSDVRTRIMQGNAYIKSEVTR